MPASSVDRVVRRAVGRWPDRPVRVTIGTTIALVGGVILALLVSESLGGFTNPFTLFLGGVFPLGLATCVAVGGVWLALSEYDRISSAHVGLWWLVGSVVASGTGVAIVLFQDASGIAVTDPAVIVAGNAATGGLGGIVVGLYSAQRLENARQRERERLADEREKLVLLNRIVRHDIGNDLQVISGMADYLERHVDDSGREPLHRLQQTTAEAVELTEQVRLFVDALDESPSDRRPISLGRIVRTQVSNARERYPEASVDIVENIPDVEVLADELLASVVHNLVSNAVSHNDTDSPTVEIRATVVDDCVRIRVADDGPGVPDDRKGTLFDRGEQGLDSSGSGIGLYIVQTLVERYGGAVWVEDNDPRGAVFVVELEVRSHEQSADDQRLEWAAVSDDG